MSCAPENFIMHSTSTELPLVSVVMENLGGDHIDATNGMDFLLVYAWNLRIYSS
jgi:hypothetical protein